MNPVVLVALLALFLAGCKRRETIVSANTASTTPVATISADGMPAPGPPTQAPDESVVIPDSPDMNATLEQLSTEFRVYVSRTRSRPKDFQEFVSLAHLQAPLPPSGQSYAIAGGKVVLVKNK